MEDNNFLRVNLRNDHGDDSVLEEIEAALEQLLVGKTSAAPIETRTSDPIIGRLVELVNSLSGNYAEMANFALELSKGNLKAPLPGRRNYLAASLKELHTQLRGFTWAADQVIQGQGAYDLGFMGELSDTLGALIKASTNQPSHANTEDNPANGLQFHQMQLIFDHLPHMILLNDAEGNTLLTNQLATQYFGGHPFSQELAKDHPSNLYRTICECNCEESTFPTYREVQDESTGVWYRVTSDQFSLPGEQFVYLHCIEDVSEWKLNENELRISATVDPLTGVYNRTPALCALEAAIAAKDRFISCAAFLDIDELKTINDTYGHNEGDYVIRTIAQIVARSVRDIDTVSRFGGDEFLVVFTECDQSAAEAVMQRVRDKVDILNATHSKPYNLSFSYGVVQIDQKTEGSVKDLITIMDKKMYERKKQRRLSRLDVK